MKKILLKEQPMWGEVVCVNTMREVVMKLNELIERVNEDDTNTAVQEEKRDRYLEH